MDLNELFSTLLVSTLAASAVIGSVGVGAFLLLQGTFAVRRAFLDDQHRRAKNSNRR